MNTLVEGFLVVAGTMFVGYWLGRGIAKIVGGAS